MSERDWKLNPPKDRAEGLDCMFYLMKTAVEEGNRKHGFGGRIERHGNLAIITYPDGHVDRYEIGADMIQ